MSARATQGAAGDYAADLAPDARQPGKIRSQTTSCPQNSELTKSAKALADGFAALPAGRTTWMSAIPISQSGSTRINWLLSSSRSILSAPDDMIPRPATAAAVAP